jgi:hypothetical protein
MKSHTLSLVAAMVLQAPTLAQVHYIVDSAGGGTHTTIQGAVDVAVDGDVIELRSGPYVEIVSVVGKGITLVSAGPTPVVIRGTLRVQATTAFQTVLCANFTVQPLQGTQPVTLPPALLVHNCQGPVRLQQLALTGAAGGWVTPPMYYRPGVPGGDALRVTNSADVALIDCTLTGGRGAASAGIPWDGGSGGHGILATGASRLVVQRCVVRGGLPEVGEGGGSGGSGAIIEPSAELLVGYSAFFGQDGADAWNLQGGNGGFGVYAFAGTTVHDFAGLYFAGVQGHTWMPLGAPPIDGTPLGGPGTVLTVPPAHPSALHAPNVVRAGQAWSFDVVAQPNELVLPLAGDQASFRWSPAMRQPLLFFVDRAASAALGGWRTVPASSQVHWPQPPVVLGPGQAPRVLWLGARVVPNVPRLTSTRAVVVLP